VLKTSRQKSKKRSETGTSKSTKFSEKFFENDMKPARNLPEFIDNGVEKRYDRKIASM
jgi:hypothetical protein